MKQNFIGRYWLPGLSFLLFVASLYLVFLYVPTVTSLGATFAQRIFYFHVPVDWVAFLSFFVVFIASIMYLSKRDDKWDLLAHTAAEIGVIFNTLMLITGSIWAKPAWGAWWVWDPRLTTALVLWFIYVAYLLIRSYASEESRGARFAAVVGIVGFIDVPIVALATTLWRTQHPSALIFESGGLAPSQVWTLMVCLAAFTTLYITLLRLRLSLRKIERDIRIIAKEKENQNPA
jgi:heme exporter protein C